MTQPQPITPPKEPTPDDELKEMALALHRSLKSFVVYLEKKYQVGDESPNKKKRAA